MKKKESINNYSANLINSNLKKLLFYVYILYYYTSYLIKAKLLN